MIRFPIKTSAVDSLFIRHTDTFFCKLLPYPERVCSTPWLSFAIYKRRPVTTDLLSQTNHIVMSLVQMTNKFVYYLLGRWSALLYPPLPPHERYAKPSPCPDSEHMSALKSKRNKHRCFNHYSGRCRWFLIVLPTPLLQSVNKAARDDAIESHTISFALLI